MLKKYDAGLFMLMPMVRGADKKSFSRELLVFCPSESTKQITASFGALKEMLTRCEEYGLHEMREVNCKAGVYLWWQVANLKYSRKVVEPIVRGFYTEKKNKAGCSCEVM